MKMPLLAALLLSTASAAGPDSAPLTGSVWTLTQVAPRGEALTPGEPLRKPTLKIMPGGMLTGTTGCNGFSGWATVKGQTMKVTPLKLSGKSNCPDHALSLEADFVNLLQNARRFDIKDNTLTIHGEGNQFITFQASQGVKSVTGNLPQLSSMKGQWQLTKLLHQGQPVKFPSDSKLTIQDTATGVEVRGKAGCNTLFGKVTLKGRTVSVTDLGMTMMLCDDMASENAVVDILRVPVTVTENGSTMTWRNDRGELTLTRVNSAAPNVNDFNPKALEGRTFTLKTVAGQPIGETMKPVTISFTAGRVGGSDGCNSFGGTVTWQGNRVTAGQLSSTLMACPGMEKVPSISDFLKLKPAVELTGNTLRLTANGTVWEFAGQP